MTTMIYQQPLPSESIPLAFPPSPSQSNHLLGWWLVYYIFLMKTSGSMRAMCQLLLLLLAICPCLQQCSSNCTANTTNAYCSSQGYCTCMLGYIFNCNTPATIATDHSYLQPLSSSRPYYYILNSQLGKELEYSVAFSDPNYPNILQVYQPEFLTDEGMNYPPAITYTLTSYNNQPNYFTCTFRIKLNSPHDAPPERLIMRISISVSGMVPSLSFTYGYALPLNNASIFLILGYVAGGMLVATSILFIVLIYRKRRPGRRLHQQKEENLQFDITHFNELMPQMMISPDHKRDNTTCSVCLQEYDFNATVRMTACLHLFHTACIDEWCKKNLSCPNCRSDLSRASILSLLSQRAQKQKKQGQNDWIINSLAEQQQPSTLRNPLSGNQHL